MSVLLLLILSKWLYSRNLVGCLFDAKPCAVIAIQFDYFKITIQLPITKFSVYFIYLYANNYKLNVQGCIKVIENTVPKTQDKLSKP